MTALQAAGWQPESNDLQASHYSFATLPVTLTYANANVPPIKAIAAATDQITFANNVVTVAD